MVPDNPSPTPVRVDFYVLTAAETMARMVFAARLAEKAWHRGQRIAILVPDAATATQLDTHLWAFRPDAFLPHAIAPDPALAASSPVLIGSDITHLHSRDLLINFSDRLSDTRDTFGRIAEIVIQQPDLLAESRRRYMHYRTCGYTVHTHKMTSD